jgi:phosphate transport system substrate-binding protein
MKTIFASVMAAVLSFGPFLSAMADVTLNGAGATFPYPIYSKWFDEYHKIHPDVKINYQSIGSGGGIKQLIAGTVDFGATDGPMSDAQLAQVKGKVLHIPTVIGGVVPTFNVEGVSDLKFTGPVLARIFLGYITKWNDPSLTALNPDAKLPDAPITVVHRADGSGTTFCWTDYLSKAYPDWKDKVGRGTSVNWPVVLGAKGNEGVSGLVKQSANSIGYVELIYAFQNNLGYGSVKNQAGKFLKASLDTISAAAAGVKMPKDFRVSITNAKGENAYPISTFTWLLIREKNEGTNGQVLQDFISWMLEDGQKMAPDLNYAPLPNSVKAMIKKKVPLIS